MTKKIIITLTALVTVLALSLTAFAEEKLFALDAPATPDPRLPFKTGFEVSGWYPAVITEYSAPDIADQFIEAIQKENAKIAITYTGDAEIDLLLQAYDSDKYTHATSGPAESVEDTADGKKRAIFDCASLIAKYTGTPSGTGTGTLSLDDVLNFSIGGEGNTVYAVEVIAVVSEASEVESSEPTEQTEADTTEASDESTESTSPETGIVLSVIPLLIALAGVNIFKKR